MLSYFLEQSYIHPVVKAASSQRKVALLTSVHWSASTIMALRGLPVLHLYTMARLHELVLIKLSTQPTNPATPIRAQKFIQKAGSEDTFFWWVQCNEASNARLLGEWLNKLIHRVHQVIFRSKKRYLGSSMDEECVNWMLAANLRVKEGSFVKPWY
jgi:hypothetical protein